MIRYEDDWYEPPNDEERIVFKLRPKRRDKERSKWRPLRNQRPKIIRGFGK
jgi:hypothetical protein